MEPKKIIDDICPEFNPMDPSLKDIAGLGEEALDKINKHASAIYDLTYFERKSLENRLEKIAIGCLSSSSQGAMAIYDKIIKINALLNAKEQFLIEKHAHELLP